MDGKRRVALAAGVGLAGTGLWAFFAPASFYDFATYPPYNRHFIHDVGAFLLGLGAVLAIAGFVRDGLFVAVGGNAVGAWFHGISHLIDKEIGGGSWRDPVLTIGFAIALSAFAWSVRPSKTPAS